MVSLFAAATTSNAATVDISITLVDCCQLQEKKKVYITFNSLSHLRCSDGTSSVKAACVAICLRLGSILSGGKKKNQKRLFDDLFADQETAFK